MKPESVKKFIDPFSIGIDLESGEMVNASNHLIRRASDMKGYYKDENALLALIKKENDPTHYEVFEYPVPEEYGHLMYCISKLQPGNINSEFFMTKGHYHSIIQTAEIYLCLKGEGYILLKTYEGRSEAVPMKRGQMVYVPPFWAHRSINTGHIPLISFCIYQADAGHNYGDISIQGFPKRIFQIGDSVKIL